MKLVLIPIFYFLGISCMYSQEEKSPIVQWLFLRKYNFPDSTKENILPDSTKKWPDTLFYNTVYKARLLGSGTIPISFSKIVYSNGKYEVSPTISLGYGYTWFFGDFILNENDKITVDATFFFGLTAEIGLQNNLSLDKLAGFVTGGFIGTGAFSLFFGYDYISMSGTIGLGGRIDLYTIRQKALKPIGKVREVRRHKSIVPKVSNE
jgi:hypothetical protein